MVWNRIQSQINQALPNECEPGSIEPATLEKADRAHGLSNDDDMEIGSAPLRLHLEHQKTTRRTCKCREFKEKFGIFNRDFPQPKRLRPVWSLLVASICAINNK
jgi:hypothetical protein